MLRGQERPGEGLELEELEEALKANPALLLTQVSA